MQKKKKKQGASAGSAHLRQLLGDAPEHVVVQVPGLRQVLHVAGAHVLPAPVLSLHQVPAVSLQARGRQTSASLTRFNAKTHYKSSKEAAEGFLLRTENTCKDSSEWKHVKMTLHISRKLSAFKIAV